MRKIPDELKPPCCICGKPKAGSIEGKFYCNKHWQSMYRYGTPYGKQRERTNSYVCKGDVLYITTAKGEVILADSSDLEELSKHSWCISKTGYPVARVNGKVMKLHRYLLKLDDPKKVVDHINHNPLDNRRSNMRVCTSQENSRNKGGGHPIHGIRLMKSGKYQVRIMFQRKEYRIGYFTNLEDAIKARFEAEDRFHGEFAYHRSKL